MRQKSARYMQYHDESFECLLIILIQLTVLYKNGRYTLNIFIR